MQLHTSKIMLEIILCDVDQIKEVHCTLTEEGFSACGQ
jgi:hypothetical protein